MIRAILNPRSGTAARRAYSVLERGTGAWEEIEVKATERRGHARELARQAVDRGDPVLLVAGGDGTCNEAARALVGTKTALAILPVGSGNGLARTLGIPLRPDRALAALEAGADRSMDVGHANGRLFLNIAGAGFDAAVGNAFHERGAQGGRRGVLTYTWLSMSMLLAHRASAFTLDCRGTRLQGHAFLVAIANGRQYGGGAVVAPRARLDDGLLDFLVIDEAPPLEILLAAPRAFLGTIEGFRRYRHVQAGSAEISFEAPVEHHCDGEPEGRVDSLRIEVRPRALRVRVPRGLAERPDGPLALPSSPAGASID
jgi:YegS/Rv2252/BmrU family lipid kinase